MDTRDFERVELITALKGLHIERAGNGPFFLSAQRVTVADLWGQLDDFRRISFG